MGLYGNKQRPANAPALYPVLSLLLGATLWGVIWYPMRLLEDGGLHGVWLTLILYVAALAVSLPRTFRTLPEFADFPLGLFVLAIAGGWTNIAFVLAVLEGNILRVLLLFYLSPVWAVIMGWLFLGERPSLIALISLASAMIGAGVMLWNPAVGLPWPDSRADWYALSAGFAFAVSNVAVRKLALASIGAKSVSVWLGVAIIATLLILAFELPPPAVAQPVLFGAVALGIFGILGMTLLVQYGVTHMPIHRSAVIMLFELIAGAASQQLLTNEVMTLSEWVGGIFIVIAAYVSARL